MTLWPDFALARAAMANAVDRRLVRDDRPREFERDRMDELLVRRRPTQPLSMGLIYD